MTEIIGLKGLRPTPGKAGVFTSPPYDVIKPGTPLERLLQGNPQSLYHIILGTNPAAALQQFKDTGLLVEDDEPCVYIYEQSWGSERRLGLLSAVKVDDYHKKTIIRHEKTFDKKVTGRIQLARNTGHTIGPIFLLTQSSITPLLEAALQGHSPLYDFTSDFGTYTDLHGLHSRIFRLPFFTPAAQALKTALSSGPLYIADGHHRYHAALRGSQTHTLSYITDNAHIQAYNRVINGKHTFESIMGQLELTPCNFATPPVHYFSIYSRQGAFSLKARQVPGDPVGSLDCSILESELYPLLGITHEMRQDHKHFDYYPESELSIMKALVDEGRYDIALALHPVTKEQLLTVADAGLQDSNIVMPEKSTFFSPKILSGLFLYRHESA